MKKLVYLLAPLMCFSSLASCGGNKPEPGPEPVETFNVTHNIDIKIDKNTATKSVEFNTNISINKEEDYWVLGDQASQGFNIEVAGSPLQDTMFNYQLNTGMKTASLKINAEAITGDININIPVINNSGYYIVDFNPNGGSYVSPQRVKGGEKATKPINPTKDGFTFSGWYHMEEGIPVEFDFTTPIRKSIILEAKWIEETVEFRFMGYGCAIKGIFDYRESLYKGDEVTYEVNTLNDEFILPETADCSNTDIVYQRDASDLHKATLTVTVTDISKIYRAAISCDLNDYVFFGIHMEHCTIENVSDFIGFIAPQEAEQSYSINCQLGYHLPDDITVIYPEETTELPEGITYSSVGTITITSDLKQSVILKLEAIEDEPVGKNDVVFSCDNNTTAGFDDSGKIQYSNFGMKEFADGETVNLEIKVKNENLVVQKETIDCELDGEKWAEYELTKIDNTRYKITFVDTGFVTFSISAKTISSFSYLTFKGCDTYNYSISDTKIESEDQKYYFEIPSGVGFVYIKVDVSKSDGTDMSNAFKAYNVPIGEEERTEAHLDYVPNTDNKSASLFIQCCGSVSVEINA